MFRLRAGVLSGRGPFRPSGEIPGDGAGSVVRETEHGHKSRLGYFDPADLPHALFTLFLFFEQFAFAGDVASVALGSNVLADSLDRFAGDDLGSDGRLKRNVELLAGDQAAELLDDLLADVVRIGAVYQRGERIDRFRISTLTRPAWRKSMGV